jgi:hypothetical protein
MAMSAGATHQRELILMGTLLRGKVWMRVATPRGGRLKARLMTDGPDSVVAEKTDC